MGNPDEAKLSIGAKEDKSDPNSCACTTYSNEFNGKMTSHMDHNFLIHLDLLVFIHLGGYLRFIIC